MYKSKFTKILLAITSVIFNYQFLNSSCIEKINPPSEFNLQIINPKTCHNLKFLSLLKVVKYYVSHNLSEQDLSKLPENLKKRVIILSKIYKTNFGPVLYKAPANSGTLWLIARKIIHTNYNIYVYRDDLTKIDDYYKKLNDLENMAEILIDYLEIGDIPMLLAKEENVYHHNYYNRHVKENTLDLLVRGSKYYLAERLLSRIKELGLDHLIIDSILSDILKGLINNITFTKADTSFKFHKNSLNDLKDFTEKNNLKNILDDSKDENKTFINSLLSNLDSGIGLANYFLNFFAADIFKIEKKNHKKDLTRILSAKDILENLIKVAFIKE